MLSEKLDQLIDVLENQELDVSKLYFGLNYLQLNVVFVYSRQTVLSRPNCIRSCSRRISTKTICEHRKITHLKSARCETK